jgi:hypothetical protein
MSMLNFGVTPMPGGVDVATERDWDKKMFFEGVTLEDMTRGALAYYEEEKFIQDAFPFLNSDEREFLMTGMTPEDWARAFPNND